MVTHPSSPDVHVGTAPHNARLAFYGRRLLAMHFQLFVLDAAARVGPTAVSANGGFHAVPVDTRLAGPKSQRKSAPGDGTPDGLAAAVLDDAVLGRMVGYDWKIKELANWTHKMGYDARGSLVTSIYGGLAHAYVSRPPLLLLLLHPPPFPRHLAPSSRAVGTAGARRWRRAARGVAGQTPAGRGPRPRACADDALRRATQPPVRPSSSGAAGGRRVRPRGPPVRSLPRSCPKRRRPPPSLPSPLLTPPPPLPCDPQGLPATQRIFLADTLPALKPLLPAWLRPEADRQAERVLEQGGVWGPSGAVGVEGAGEAGEGAERVEV